MATDDEGYSRTPQEQHGVRHNPQTSEAHGSACPSTGRQAWQRVHTP